MNYTKIPLRLLEINSSLVWHWPHIEDLLQLIKEDHFNGLIIHEYDILTLLAEPSIHCKHERVELERKQQDALLYLKKVAHLCRVNNIQFWLQGKAIPDISGIIQKFPEYSLIDTLKSSEHFWKMFYVNKLSLILDSLVGLSGLSITLNPPATIQADWEVLIPLLYKTVRKHGKRLVIRNYINNDWQEWQITSVFDHLPIDIPVSIKATYQSYYPGVADNPLFDHYPKRRKWIEFDLWGIEYGWTLLPCYLLNELQQRLIRAQDKFGQEIEAVIAKLSLEWISNSSLVRSINSINLYGLAMFGHEATLTEKEIIQQWFGKILNRPLLPLEIKKMHEMLNWSYEWIYLTIYVQGRVFHYHSQIPENYQHGCLLLNEGRLLQSHEGKESLLTATNLEESLAQVELIQLEKNRAQFLSDAIYQRLYEFNSQLIDLPEGDRKIFLSVAERMPWYTKMFSLTTESLVLGYIIEHYPEAKQQKYQLQQLLHEMRLFSQKLNRWLDDEQGDHPHYMFILFNPKRLNHFIDDIDSIFF